MRHEIFEDDRLMERLIRENHENRKPLELWPDPVAPKSGRRVGGGTATKLQAILGIMSDGQWRTVPEIQQQLERDFNITTSETGCSARIRDLRKPENGGHTILIQRVRGAFGFYEYRLERGPLEPAYQGATPG